jgi:hypothetical protein
MFKFNELFFQFRDVKDAPVNLEFSLVLPAAWQLNLPWSSYFLHMYLKHLSQEAIHKSLGLERCESIKVFPQSYILNGETQV